MFATILTNDDVAEPNRLWERFAEDMTEDLTRQLGTEPQRHDAALELIAEMLAAHGRSLEDYQLPVPTGPGIQALRIRELRLAYAYDPDAEAARARAHRSTMTETQSRVCDLFESALSDGSPAQL